MFFFLFCFLHFLILQIVLISFCFILVFLHSCTFSLYFQEYAKKAEEMDELNTELLEKVLNFIWSHSFLLESYSQLYYTV